MVVTCSAVAFVAVARAQDPPGRAAATPAQLYETACASCHGSDGRGLSATQIGFDVPLPDFTDCSFATREPDADWFAVAHQGGPTRVFDEKMPAFGAALTEAELRQILSHVRSFCTDDAWPPGELNLPRALLTEKAYVEDEAVLSSGVTLEGPLEIDGKLIYETRVGPRSQFELIVPFAIMEREDADPQTDGWSEGVGDIAVGVKHVLIHSGSTGTILSAAGEVTLPTGDEADGLGAGTFRFEPFLAFGQVVEPVGFIQFQGGVELPTDPSRAEREGFGRVAIGQSVTEGRFGRTWSPMFEFAAKGELEAGAPIEWDYVPQMQVTLNRRQHIMLNVGVRMPLTDYDTRPTELLMYLLWDWFDGGFFDGW